MLYCYNQNCKASMLGMPFMLRAHDIICLTLCRANKAGEAFHFSAGTESVKDSAVCRLQPLKICFPEAPLLEFMQYLMRCSSTNVSCMNSRQLSSDTKSCQLCYVKCSWLVCCRAANKPGYCGIFHAHRGLEKWAHLTTML